jgi:hypothetical protein
VQAGRHVHNLANVLGNHCAHRVADVRVIHPIPAPGGWVSISRHGLLPLVEKSIIITKRAREQALCGQQWP